VLIRFLSLDFHTIISVVSPPGFVIFQSVFIFYPILCQYLFECSRFATIEVESGILKTNNKNE